GLNAPLQTYTLAFGAPGFPVFPSSLSAPPSVANSAPRTIDLRSDTLLNPYTSQFTFGIQQQFPHDWILTADVIHSQTVKLIQAYDLNRPVAFIRTAPGRVRSVAEADSTRPFSTFMGIPVRQVQVTGNGGTGVYDALDVGLSRRFNGRYQLGANYVYSSALNNVTDDHLGANPNDWNDVGLGERGPSDFHQRHRFVAHGTVLLPFRSEFSLIATLASGLPVNPVTGIDNNGDTTNIDRPAGYSRNSFRAPGQTSFDVAYTKTQPLSESIRLELRADVFNFFNNSNFYRLNNVYGNGMAPLPTFMQPLAGIANVDPGRQFQFAAKLVF
ncbi:MAG: hypothetical protein ACRD7E_25245, partial [Bryobacteraceae bacterium]